MPSRMTEKSCRPRVSNRTMVGNSATRLACEFQRTEGRRHDTNMKPQGGRSIAGPSLRGLWGRSATGHNGQAAKEEISARWRGAGWRKNVSGVPAGRSVFHLTSLFIGLTYLADVNAKSSCTYGLGCDDIAAARESDGLQAEVPWRSRRRNASGSK
jgi:hypothetical protein